MKRINKYFFDRESPKKDYILGTFYANYIPVGKNGILFRSPKKDLVQIVKNALNSQHTIVSDPRDKSSHWLQIDNSPLRHQLDSLGLNVPKDKREFPQYPERMFLSHFVRGFLEARTKLITGKRNTYLRIGFNESFLSSLDEVLVKYVGVQPGKLKENYLWYHQGEFMRIYDFIYQNWDDIAQKNLYLPSLKEGLEKDYSQNVPVYKFVKEAQARVERVKERLLTGEVTALEAASEGYHNPHSVYQSFKKQTGMTVRAFLRLYVVPKPKAEIRNRIEQAKELLLNGAKGTEITPQIGYKNVCGFYTLFKKVTGMTTKEYKKKFIELKPLSFERGV